MLERIGAKLGRDKMIPTYQDRASSLRQRAILESLKSGLTIDPQKGVDLVEAKSTTAVSLSGDRTIEFAIDDEGIAFARISDGKYYPLDTNLPKEFLDWSKSYDKLARSRLRRFFLSLTDETRSRQYFELAMSIGGLSDSVTLLCLAVEDLESSIDKWPNSETTRTYIGQKTL